MPGAGHSASPFANPVRVSQGVDRASAIRRYHGHLCDRPDLVSRMLELRVRTVECWCRRGDEPRTADTVCHADVLVPWLRYFADGTLRGLGEHGMPVGWVNELETRVEVEVVRKARWGR